MKNSIRSASVSVLILLLIDSLYGANLKIPTQSSPQPADAIPSGRVVPSIACRNKPEQTYALYLPSSFTPDKTWPLIAAFDPGARGNMPVESFKEAAERYGYIVCGSNNSRNGPWAPTVEAADAMLNDVSARFPIAEKRVYLAGFSGGARVASQIAVMLPGRVAGVIGSGAGLAFGLEPAAMKPYAYYGTIGAEDFNYPEMKQLDRQFDAAGVAHRIEIFDGDHGWAPSASYVRAIEWLELQAMKSAIRPRDDAFIDRVFSQARQELAAQESAGNHYEAYFVAIAISADFKGLGDVAEFERKVETLKDSKSVKSGLKRDRDRESEQMRRGTELFTMRARLRNPAVSAALSGAESSSETPQSSPGNTLDAADERQIVLTDLKNKLAALRRASQAKENTSERLLARRILNQYLVSQFEQSNALMRSKKYDLAATDLAVEAELQPENPRVLYTLARASALKGDKRRALDALNRAVQKGFTNIAELERNHDLDSIREEEQFKKIVESLRGKS
jgi:dienelactone hydrolase